MRHAECQSAQRCVLLKSCNYRLNKTSRAITIALCHSCRCSFIEGLFRMRAEDTVFPMPFLVIIKLTALPMHTGGSGSLDDAFRGFSYVAPSFLDGFSGRPRSPSKSFSP